MPLAMAALTGNLIIPQESFTESSESSETDDHQNNDRIESDSEAEDILSETVAEDSETVSTDSATIETIAEEQTEVFSSVNYQPEETNIMPDLAVIQP